MGGDGLRTPTEEVFTSPHRERVEGVVRSTKPLLLLGALVRDIELRFEGGEAVEIRAAEGEALLQEHMATDAGASRLGEVAFVDARSRVRETGITFFDTLFDENAASHIAYGAGLPESLPEVSSSIGRSASPVASTAPPCTSTS